MVFGMLAASLPAVFAGRPLTIDDAEPVPSGAFELEAGIRYSKLRPGRHYDFPAGLAAGVVPRLELGMGFGGQIEEREEFGKRRRVRSGLGDFLVGGKVKLLDATNYWFDQSIAPAVKLPTADDDRDLGSGHTDYDVTWIASYPATGRINLHLNAGYTWVGGRTRDGHDDIVHYGLAGDYALNDKVQVVGELFADTPVRGSEDTGVVVNGGVRWTLGTVTLDAAIGTGVRGDSPDWTATLGLTWLIEPRCK